MKCATSGILPVSRRQHNEVKDFLKSNSLIKSTNRDSSIVKPHRNLKVSLRSSAKIKDLTLTNEEFKT